MPFKNARAVLSVFVLFAMSSFGVNTFDAQIRDLYLKALKSDKEIDAFK